MSPVDSTAALQDWQRKRFFVALPNALDNLPAEIRIESRDLCHYLGTVVRVRKGERVVIADDQRERAYLAEILELGKSDVVFCVECEQAPPTHRLPDVTLAVALIKEQRWDSVLQKATELGVRTIQPLMAEHSVVRLTAADMPRKLERWQSVLRSAAEQSEGLFIPEILPPLTVENYCAQSQPEALRILLLERKANRKPLKAVLSTLKPGQPLVMAVGPEGGWTDAEIAAFEQVGFVSASLGDRILRSETAAMAALSAVVYEVCDADEAGEG
ncbi:MAG TPA: RsmE family RNA methyltransferase [Coleofasciculaceae cyanobacterium]|jgi:16S rRNA (uracil1498-N3)-methyltransferase